MADGRSLPLHRPPLHLAALSPPRAFRKTYEGSLHCLAIMTRLQSTLVLLFSCSLLNAVTGWTKSPPLKPPRHCTVIHESPSCFQQQDKLTAAYDNVTILDRGEHYLVVAKPPSVVCHHSEFTGSRGSTEIPMLQRIRDTVQQRVNLVHRLDRGASGCLLCTFQDDHTDATRIFSEALTSANKTYVALVRGEGILHGKDLKRKGWFSVTRPIKDERGVLKDATTYFYFCAGQDNANGTIDRPRASLVLARPCTGRWHQIRRHLNGLSHPILGDSTHGSSKVNREWKERYGMPPERTCLHLAQLVLPPTSACPDGIHVSCPIPNDMMDMLKHHLPRVLEEARPILKKEGIVLPDETPVD